MLEDLLASLVCKPEMQLNFLMDYFLRHTENIAKIACVALAKICQKIQMLSFEEGRR